MIDQTGLEEGADGRRAPFDQELDDIVAGQLVEDLAEVAANVVPFKRPVYQRVAAEFGPVIAARRGAGAAAPWWGRTV